MAGLPVHHGWCFSFVIRGGECIHVNVSAGSDRLTCRGSSPPHVACQNDNKIQAGRQAGHKYIHIGLHINIKRDTNTVQVVLDPSLP